MIQDANVNKITMYSVKISLQEELEVVGLVR